MDIKIPQMIKIEGGYFWMGSKPAPYPSEVPYHKLYIDPFYIGKFPITVEEFSYFKKMNSYDVSEKNNPIRRITWYEAVDYCEWLADLSGEPYRLPTEAEWEYAAKAGQNLKYPTETGDISSKLANYGNSTGNITSVGKYPPNPLGLYDMAGNVWEWCSSKKGDYRGDYCTRSYDYPYDKNDGREEMDRNSASRILRGGCYSNQSTHCRSSARYREFEYRSYNYHQSRGENCFGFRVAKSI